MELVGEAVYGPVPVNRTVAPEPIEIAEVMSVVRAALVVAEGVAYVVETTPFNVRPVPSVPEV